MISSPLCPNKLAFLIYLVFEVISKSIESINKVLFKCIKSGVHNIHLLNCIFFVIRDVSVEKMIEVINLTYMCLQIVILAFSWTQYEHSSCLQSPKTCPSFSSWAVKGFHSHDVSAQSYLLLLKYKSIIIIKVKFSARWQLLRACASAESATTCCSLRSRRPRIRILVDLSTTAVSVGTLRRLKLMTRQITVCTDPVSRYRRGQDNREEMLAPSSSFMLTKSVSRTQLFREEKTSHAKSVVTTRLSLSWTLLRIAWTSSLSAPNAPFTGGKRSLLRVKRLNTLTTTRMTSESVVNNKCGW